MPAMVLLVLLCTSAEAFSVGNTPFAAVVGNGRMGSAIDLVVGNRSIEFNKTMALAVHQELDEHASMVFSLMELSETTMTTTAQKTKVRRVVQRCPLRTAVHSS